MKVTAYIHAQWNRYSEEFSFQVFGADMTQYGYALLSQVEVEFESPMDVALRNAVSVALRSQATKIRADAFMQAQALDDQAQELLALDFKPEPSNPN